MSREAQRARTFAERMSSSAAVRSVQDYTNAGLNPALAYERPASTPGSAVAQVDDSVAKSVSSALAARQLQANVELTKAQTDKTRAEAELANTDVSMRTITEGDEPTWREAQIAERVARLRDLAHTGRLQPHDERLRSLAVQLQREALKRGQFFGNAFEDAGAARDAVEGFIRRGFSSAQDAKRALDAWYEATRSTLRGAERRVEVTGDRLSRRLWKPDSPAGRIQRKIQGR